MRLFNNQLIVTGFSNFVQKEKNINDHLQKVEEENERWAEEHPSIIKDENSENNNELNQLNNEMNNEQNSEVNNED